MKDLEAEPAGSPGCMGIWGVLQLSLSSRAAPCCAVPSTPLFRWACEWPAVKVKPTKPHPKRRERESLPGVPGGGGAQWLPGPYVGSPVFVLNWQLRPDFSWLLYIPRELKMLVRPGWQSAVEVKSPARLLGCLGRCTCCSCRQVRAGGRGEAGRLGRLGCPPLLCAPPSEAAHLPG